MGPLELSDLIGLDTMLLVAEVLYDEFKEKLYAPPAVLKRTTSNAEYSPARYTTVEMR